MLPTDRTSKEVLHLILKRKTNWLPCWGTARVAFMVRDICVYYDLLTRVSLRARAAHTMIDLVFSHANSRSLCKRL